MSQFDRSELMSLAEICCKNGRYEDVISYMKEVVRMGTPLNLEERKVVFYSYDYLLQPYIDSIISCDNSCVEAKLQKEISQKAKSETNRICDEAIELLDSYWVKRDTNIEAVASYKCFRAVILGYKAFTASGQLRNSETNKSIKLFEESYEIASKNLSPAHSLTISIAKKFFVLQHLRLVSVDKAISFATEAYNKGLSHLHEIPEELKTRAQELLEKLKEGIYYLKQQ